MFRKGQKVVCVDNKMENIGPALENGNIYQVREFMPPEECLKAYRPNNTWGWEKQGGKVTLENGTEWYGRRFKPAEEYQGTTNNK